MRKPKNKASGSAKQRNLLHDHPLLAKGAAHGKPRKAERRADRVRLKQPDKADGE